MKIGSISLFFSLCFFPLLSLIFLFFSSVGWAGTRLVDFLCFIVVGLGAWGLDFVWLKLWRGSAGERLRQIG